MKHVIAFAKGNTRSRIPILSQVAVMDGVAMATDMDYTISTAAELDGTALEDGVYCPWLLTAGVRRQSPYPVTDFPKPKDEGEELATITLQQEDIKALQWVMIAMSTEETRYYLQGVAFRKGDFCATDGHRLHMAKFRISKKQEFSTGLIVPRIVMKAVMKIVKSEKPENIRITFHARRATIHIGGYTVHTKLIDGTFPSVEHVIPEHTRTDDKGNKEYYGRKTRFDPAEIKRAIPTLRALQRAHQVYMKALYVRLEKGKLQYSKEPDWHRDIVVDTEIPLGFNANYLSDMIAGELRYGESYDPAIIKSGNLVGIVMPTRP